MRDEEDEQPPVNPEDGTGTTSVDNESSQNDHKTEAKDPAVSQDVDPTTQPTSQSAG